MGKTEKIVVLSVLFAIVVLFVWSLDQGGAQAKVDGDRQPNPRGSSASATPAAAPGPGKGATASDAGSKAATPPVRPPVDPTGLASRGGSGEGIVTPRPHAPARPAVEDQGSLLIAEVTPPKRPGVVLKAEWDLVSLEGLETTLDPEMFVGTARAGDTWATLAGRYYGNASRAVLLQRANEGLALREDVAFFAPALDTLPKVPEVRQVEVLQGEGLWNVAKRALGSGDRWRELYEANRERIPNPDFVKPGTLLRLP